MKAMILTAVLVLTGCYYDMRADAWALAEAMCAPHGGVSAADETWIAGGGSLVEAKCSDGVRVKNSMRRTQ